MYTTGKRVTQWCEMLRKTIVLILLYARLSWQYLKELISFFPSPACSAKALTNNLLGIRAGGCGVVGGSERWRKCFRVVMRSIWKWKKISTLRVFLLYGWSVDCEELYNYSRCCKLYLTYLFIPRGCWEWLAESNA